MTRLRIIFILTAFLTAATASDCLAQGQTGDHAMACCRQMGDHCSSKKMPSPQSCCKSGSRDKQPYLTSAANPHVTSGPVVVAALPPTVNAAHHIHHVAALTVLSHSPPVSLPETITILRI